MLTFRSFEYQAIALARLFAGRQAAPLPPVHEQKKWERTRAEFVNKEHRRFHAILWEAGETIQWLRFLFEFAGLPQLEGLGKCPPILSEETRWAIEHVRKYPEPGEQDSEALDVDAGDWVFVDLGGRQKDLLHFI